MLVIVAVSGPRKLGVAIHDFPVARPSHPVIWNALPILLSSHWGMNLNAGGVPGFPLRNSPEI